MTDGILKGNALTNWNPRQGVRSWYRNTGTYTQLLSSIALSEKISVLPGPLYPNRSCVLALPVIIRIRLAIRGWETWGVPRNKRQVGMRVTISHSIHEIVQNIYIRIEDAFLSISHFMVIQILPVFHIINKIRINSNNLYISPFYDIKWNETF